jgi:hypothetical protein
LSYTSEDDGQDFDAVISDIADAQGMLPQRPAVQMN